MVDGLASPAKQDGERIEVLDGIRGVAVLLVLLSHTSGRSQSVLPVLNFAGIGHVGVYLFFVLSGFLLSLGLFRAGVETQSVYVFYVRRIFRILPLYFLILCAVYTWQLVTGRFEPRYLHIGDGWTGLLQHLMFYRGDGVFWTIAVEMQFYLVLPPLVWVLAKYRLRGALALGLVSLLSELIYMSFHLAPGYEVPIAYISPNYRNQGTYFGIFYAGVVAAYLVHFHENAIRRQAWLIPLAQTSFIVLIFVTLACVSADFLGFSQPFYELRFVTPLYGLVFGLSLLCAYLNTRGVRFLASKVFRIWGILGFSVYLLHFFVIGVVNSLGISSPAAAFVLSVAGILLLASVTYRFIERPFINWSHEVRRIGWNRELLRVARSR